MPDPKNGAKSAEKIPALIVFGRIRCRLSRTGLRGGNESGVRRGLSSLDVQTEDHRRAAAALPEAAINAQGRFSPSPAPPARIAELERLLKAATGQGATLASGAKSETGSATISADLWRQLKPGSLDLAAGFDQNNNLIEW